MNKSKYRGLNFQKRVINKEDAGHLPLENKERYLHDMKDFFYRSDLTIGKVFKAGNVIDGIFKSGNIPKGKQYLVRKAQSIKDLLNVDFMLSTTMLSNETAEDIESILRENERIPMLSLITIRILEAKYEHRRIPPRKRT